MTRTTIDGIALPDIAPPLSCDIPIERLATRAALDARLAALPPGSVIVSCSRVTSRHTSTDGCVRGTVDQIRRGYGEPCDMPERPADLGWCWVSRDGYSSEMRAVWLGEVWRLSAPPWEHRDTLPVMPRITAGMQQSLRDALGDLDREIRGSLTEAGEALLEEVWDAVHAITGLEPAVPPLSSSPVLAMLLREPIDGSGALTATIRRDDTEGSGYTIPELIVGSDGVYERGAPHFDRFADAIAWARAAGWRVLMERTPDRDPVPGDASQPRPVAS